MAKDFASKRLAHQPKAVRVVLPEKQTWFP